MGHGQVGFFLSYQFFQLPGGGGGFDEFQGYRALLPEAELFNTAAVGKKMDHLVPAAAKDFFQYPDVPVFPPPIAIKIMNQQDFHSAFPLAIGCG
jgi:hypothetical protein